jgi:DHA1 family multidrug resistance protein-like MFS transporter
MATQHRIMGEENTKNLSLIRRSILLISVPFFLLNLLLPIYGLKIGASVLEIGVFYSVFSFVTVLLRPIVGWGLDKFGRKYFFLAGITCYAITMFSFAFIDQVWSLVLARIFQGISSSLLWISASAITADLAGEKGRSKAFGRLAEASSRGSILGAFLGFTILNMNFGTVGQSSHIANWNVLFILFGTINLAALILTLPKLSESKPNIDQEIKNQIQWTKPWLLLLFVTLVTGASASMISPILIIFLQDKLKVSLEILSFAFLPYGLVWAFLPAQFGKLADRFGRKPLMILGMIAASASSFIIPALGTIFGLAILWAFQGACYAAGDPAEQALVADLTNRQFHGRAYGLYVMCADLGATIGPLGGSWLYQTYGQSSPFYINGIILALSAFILYLFLRIPGTKNNKWITQLN